MAGQNWAESQHRGPNDASTGMSSQRKINRGWGPPQQPRPEVKAVQRCP